MNSFLFNPKTPNEIAKELVEKIKQQRTCFKIGCQPWFYQKV